MKSLITREIETVWDELTDQKKNEAVALLLGWRLPISGKIEVTPDWIHDDGLAFKDLWDKILRGVPCARLKLTNNEPCLSARTIGLEGRVFIDKTWARVLCRAAIKLLTPVANERDQLREQLATQNYVIGTLKAQLKEAEDKNRQLREQLVEMS